MASIAIGLCLSVAAVSPCGAGVAPPLRRAWATGAPAARLFFGARRGDAPALLALRRRCCPLPPPRGSCRSTPSRTRRATRSPHDMRGSRCDMQIPSAGAVPVRTPGRWSPSRCSGRASRRAAWRAVAPPRERRRPAGRRPDACSCRWPARSTRAGVAGAATEPPTPGRATAPQTDHPGTIPARATRCAATPMAPRPARARARAPGDPSAAEVVEQRLRPVPARQDRHRERERQRERRRVPETATRLRSTPAAQRDHFSREQKNWTTSRLPSR